MDLFAIRQDVPARVRLALAFASWGAVIALWFALTEWEVLPPFSLPRPAGVVEAIGRLWTEYDLLGNVFQSWWRIAQAFCWCSVVAIPLGILMASARHADHRVPARFHRAVLPAPRRVEDLDRLDDSLLETADTLGAKRRHALWLMFRASSPAVSSSFRILYDIGWTYVILTEMVNARKGVGYMVEAARKVLDFERVYAGIIAIGVAALLFRWLLGFLERRLFPWRRPARAAAKEAALGR